MRTREEINASYPDRDPVLERIEFAINQTLEVMLDIRDLLLEARGTVRPRPNRPDEPPPERLGRWQQEDEAAWNAVPKAYGRVDCTDG